MAEFIQADTGSLLEVAAQLDPAAIVAASTAATEARGSAPACGDPMPGCQAFGAAVLRAVDQIVAFCTEAEQGIQAYAQVARDSAELYRSADGTAHDTFGGGPWASLS